MSSGDSRDELSVVNLAITVVIQVLKDLLEPFFRQNWSPLSAFLTGHLTKQGEVSVKNCNQYISDPSLFSYEPHLFHFLKTDFPILIRVNACKAADIWRIRVWNYCPSSAPLPPPVEISSHWTDLGDSCEYRQCPLFWRSLRQFGRQGPLWQSAIFSMGVGLALDWLSILLAP